MVVSAPSVLQELTALTLNVSSTLTAYSETTSKNILKQQKNHFFIVPIDLNVNSKATIIAAIFLLVSLDYLD